METHAPPTFTVFTPTHNRAHMIDRVYESLRQQTVRDFEWLVIDNESKDGTPQLMERWSNEADFPIRYIYKRDEGYPTSYNIALQESRGTYMVEIASDDACAPNALERFLFHWNNIPAAEREQYATVTALCADQDGRPHGEPLPQAVLDAEYCEMRYRYQIGGEKWGCQRLAATRDFPHERLPNGEYAVEGHVWRAVGKRYRTRYINEILHTFWIHEGQLTRVAPASAAQRNVAWHRSVLLEDIDWLRYAPGEFLRSAANYSRFAFHAGLRLRTQARQMRGLRARGLWLATLPLGWLAYRRDRRRAARQAPAQEMYVQQNNAG